jgi:hypothetical protein
VIDACIHPADPRQRCRKPALRLLLAELAGQTCFDSASAIAAPVFSVDLIRKQHGDRYTDPLNRTLLKLGNK